MEEARCIYCNADDVECTGYDDEKELDEYFCHSCNEYFLLDWDEIDANNVIDEGDYPVGYTEDGEFDEDFKNEEDY